MKRVTVYENGCHKDGILVSVDGSLDKLLQDCSTKFGVEITKLFMAEGGLVGEVELIQNNDILYASKGESCASGCLKSNQSNTNNDVQLQSVKHTSDWVTLNVGGKVFMTTRSTLATKDPESMLARMFSTDSSEPWSSSIDKSGAYLIDRSPTYFEPILNYMRHGQVIIDKGTSLFGILEEAKFYGITSLVEYLESRIKEEKPVQENSPFSRREFLTILMTTTIPSELRCQGVDFSFINMSKLDLRHINFKYAIFHCANLSMANLSDCNLERADMTNACLDNAIILRARMLCVNLENATMQGCNFEDPAGKQTYLEGANLKYVNLEGSHMSGVNLRVATLRKANLQNCDLRGAILAGADLEDADLTGSDLQDANLRGANLNGAYLELIVNPLHMSQTIR